MVSASWRARREGYARLPKVRQIRRIRDRTDIEGLPSVAAERNKYKVRMHKDTRPIPKRSLAERFADNIRTEMPKARVTEIPLYADYVARKFTVELNQAVMNGVTWEMERALKVVRHRAEKQLGVRIEDSRAEREYLGRLKARVIGQVWKSAGKWESELKMSLPTATAQTIRQVLVAKEKEVRDAATTAARTVLAAVYNDYSMWLLSKGGAMKFRWVNPMDKRTSVVCNELVRATYGGVSYERLKELVRLKADPEWYRARSPWLPHPNCRSTVFVVNSKSI